jgi:hypothetical protein
VPSSLGWVVLDDAHKRAIQETAALSREQGTVDELGIGVVRDTLSDLLFPGTSVLHTRAKYLLFVPWIYDGLRADGRSGSRAVALGRQREIALINALIAGDEAGKGVIGERARASLRRLPSAAYWSALQTHRILRWNVGVTGYCQSLRATRGTGSDRLGRDEDGNSSDALGPWHALPPAEDFSTVATFDLTAAQAGYLYDRIAASSPGSMLLWLLDQPDSPVSAPWEHPELVTLNETMREVVAHAKWFSHVVHGAAILYNVMLADLSKSEDLAATYADDFDLWRATYQDEYPYGWDTDAFWRVIRRANPGVHLRTQDFLQTWFATAARVDSAQDRAARALIRDREIRLKRNLARLANQRALEMWSGASGLVPLTYRWGSVSQVAADIYLARQEG